MKSIRRSLVLYFLVLLAGALGAVSVLAYHTAQQTLQAKEEIRKKLLETQYRDRCREESAKLDNALLTQAHTLVSLAESQLEWERLRRQRVLPVAALLNVALTPTGYLLVPFPAVQVSNTPLSWWLMQRRIKIAGEIRIDEDVLPRSGSEPDTEYFQINTERGSPWHSRSMAGHSFPFNARLFATTPLLEPRFDDTQLAAHLPVRRVTLKAPVSRFRYLLPSQPSQPPRREGGRPLTDAERGPRRPPEDGERSGRRPPKGIIAESSMAIFIQCACDTAGRDEALVALKAERDAELADLEGESGATLASLRNRLLLIGVGTFAAILLGGCWLVRVGLSPLRRLTDAVSRISEKDFRLPFDEPRLPSELEPIVERLNQTLAMLKRAFAREKQAAADISHELRTPLAALLTTTEVALRKPRSPEEYRELLEDCHTSGQQMHQLVERLLALARLDAGVDQLRPQEVDVADLAAQCAALVRPLAEARSLDLRVRCKSPAYLTADPNKLREVLTNLLHNAIEYNRPQGSVDVCVERHNGSLNMEVRDTGIGIPPEAREHIFERFYRADPSRQADGMHAGLGLSIVKGYVDLMGGTIEVESTEGQGTTFRVQLPA